MKAAVLLLAFFSSISAENITALLPANVSSLGEGGVAQAVDVVSLSYPSQGVVKGRSFEAFGAASIELSAASCTGPSQCSCRADGTAFTCSFSPPVSGTYSLQLSSENLSSTYYLELHEGKQVKLTSVLEAEPPSARWPFYAMAALGIIFVAYLAYRAYGRLTRKKRSIRQLQQRKTEIEHDMEALRYRYMKREIDEITLAQLMQQKKLELIQLQAQLQDAGGKPHEPLTSV